MALLARQSASKSSPKSADFVQRTEDRQWLGRLLAGLPERSRRILEGRFGRGWTLDQIGKRENLTQERVRQIERQALERLRQEDGRGLDRTSASITTDTPNEEDASRPTRAVASATGLRG